jgi:hypothetical protein
VTQASVLNEDDDVGTVFQSPTKGDALKITYKHGIGANPSTASSKSPAALPVAKATGTNNYASPNLPTSSDVNQKVLEIVTNPNTDLRVLTKYNIMEELIEVFGQKMVADQINLQKHIDESVDARFDAEGKDVEGQPWPPEFQPIWASKGIHKSHPAEEEKGKPEVHANKPKRSTTLTYTHTRHL